MRENTYLYSFLLGVISHYLLFKHFEPNVLVFLGAVGMSWIALLAVFVQDQLHHDQNAIVAVFKAFWSTLILETIYFASMTSSIVVYRLSPWHPLSRYPGPALAKISKWWLAYWIAKGDRHRVLQRLHKKHGPWLRIGPNELSVSLPSAIRPIYGSMYRASFYQGAPGDADALITAKERGDYSRRLVAWTTAFNSESQKRYRPMAQSRTTQLLDILDQEGGKEVDLSKWISLWAMDIMGDMSFSGGFETMAAGKDSEGWLEILMTGSLAVGVLGQVPWMRDIIAMLPQPGPILTFQQFLGRKVRDLRKDNEGVPKDILGILQNDAAGKYQLTEAEAAADATFMVVAGQDTISHALISFFRYVVADPEIIRRLRDEIVGAVGTSEDMDPFILAKLPYLDACIQETLRIMPPVAGGPPRYSGLTGALVENQFIPPNTTVSCPIYVLHHDADNFKNPDVFNPDRWLSPPKPHNIEAYIPFSSGIGICLGKPVALHNMKLLTASMIRHFDLFIPPNFDLKAFDNSYKERNLWVHDPLFITVKPRQN